jgi:putative hemolysin
MSSILFPLAVITGLILVMGVLSLFEAALVAARRWRLRGQASRGDRSAAVALRLSEDLDQPTNPVRLAITLAAAAAAIYAGVWAWRILGQAEGAAGNLAKVAAAGILLCSTVAILLFGEILPRKIARRWPERIACGLARPAAAFTVLAQPLATLLGGTADLLARLVGVKPAARAAVTHEEIKGLLWEGMKAGAFGEAEHEIFKRVFRFFDRRARALMTPRDEVVWIDVADPPEEVRRKVLGCSHSRFPVCDESLDNLLGVVQVKDLLGQISGGSPFRIKGLLTLPTFIYEGARGPQILEMLKKSSSHVAVVLDEFGSVVGIVTLNDILEAVLGDVPEKAGEDEEPRSVQRPDGSWLLDGRFPLDEFGELFDLAELPQGDYQTLAGLVVTQLGHIPRIAETFDLLGLHFEVVDMDGKRVDRVLVDPLGKSRAAG